MKETRLQTNTAKTAQTSIAVNDVHRSFVTGKTVNPVLKAINLQVFAGELTMIMGPSGSGKSTLLAILSGLTRPDRGEVLALNTALWSLTEKEIDAFRLENCGFIFQGFNLFSALTALEQVILPLKYMQMSKEVAQNAARQVLKEVGLSDKLNQRPLALSGGEKQRVAIARALVKSPRLIFADEPTSALDSKNGEIIISLLHQAARQYKATVLVVTHDPRLIPHADRIIEMADGMIQSDQRPQNNLLQRKTSNENH
ncbi:MAG: ABC transporter ATP-binding protein [Nitrospirota bacterium]|nr:ABC transporter ATP-binding protein [Nitrospirota bacterium]NOY84169.1 ABC transporter ATP-binding protein [Candidatus Manganitrophaceae bacterium]